MLVTTVKQIKAWTVTDKRAAAAPRCPKGIMQWQHGSFEKLDNGSLLLTPIKVDGRQLYSDPCSYKSAIYTRWNATERFKVRVIISPTPTSHKLISYKAIHRCRRPLPQNPPPRSLPSRRRAPHAPLSRLLASEDAPYHHFKPHDDPNCRRKSQAC